MKRGEKEPLSIRSHRKPIDQMRPGLSIAWRQEKGSNEVSKAQSLQVNDRRGASVRRGRGRGRRKADELVGTGAISCLR